MQAIDINKKLVENYLELLSNLNAQSKLDLISRLTKSMKSEKHKHVGLSDALKGGFIPEKSAEVILADLKQARNFSRDIEEL